MQIHNKKKEFILGIVNACIELVYLPRKLFFKKPDLLKIQAEKILMLRLDHIGDVVMTSPAFSAVHTRFPRAKTILLTDSTGSQLYGKDPRIHEVLVFNWPWVHQKKNNRFTPGKVSELIRLVLFLRRQRIDVLIDFRGDLRFVVLFGVLTGIPIRVSNSRCGESSLLNAVSLYDVDKHEVERSLDVVECFGPVSGQGRPEISLLPDEIASIRQRLGTETGMVPFSRIAVIAPYSSKDVKSWPFHNFREVITYLSSSGFTVIVAGTKDDTEDAEQMIRGISGNVFSFAGKTSIRELASLVSISALVVGVDTGVLHIASCFDVPVFAIFGSTRSSEFRPYSPYVRVLETKTCRCNQFLHDKCDYPTDGYAGCLADLSPAAVISAINEVIHNPIILE